MSSQAELQALRQTISRQVGLSAYENLNIRCLTALERILSHVVVCLDGDRDAPVVGSDLVEVVMDALDRAKLLELAPPPPAANFAALARNLGMCRARAIPGTKTLFAICAGDVEPILLENGGTLGNETRAGHVLGRLLGAGRSEPWYIVAIRDGTARSQPLKNEQYAADRIAAAARLVDLPLTGIYLDIRGGKTHTLVEVKTDG